VGDKKDVTPTNEIWGDGINGAGKLFAAVIPHNRWKGTGSLWLPDEPLERELAARESDQLWLGALGAAMTDRGDYHERNSQQAKEDRAPIHCRCVLNQRLTHTPPFRNIQPESHYGEPSGRVAEGSGNSLQNLLNSRIASDSNDLLSYSTQLGSLTRHGRT